VINADEAARTRGAWALLAMLCVSVLFWIALFEAVKPLFS
jgi:hypothetical protein